MQTIPKERKRKLEQMFRAFSIAAEGTYAYVCDIRYDVSIWSERAVEEFGLPSACMTDAGTIWEGHIHEEDRPAYHRSIESIISGDLTGHDMQYRARNRAGEYEVCTCRGAVIEDEDGVPEYFCGVIRNHGTFNQIDPLVGLHNQYGFFDDLATIVMGHEKATVCILGLARFMDINGIYGYLAGDKILQKFGRLLEETIKEKGTAYRLEGTKFAIITDRMGADGLKEAYAGIRRTMREGIMIDGRMVSLDTSAGLLTIDDFEGDVQTVHTCLSYAYSESKNERHGDLVELFSGLTDENKKSIERLQAIRSAILQDHQGFCLFYQPIVDAETEHVAGAEALIRWREGGSSRQRSGRYTASWTRPLGSSST